MTIDESIYELNHTFCYPNYDDSLDINKAIKLGIEALQLYRKQKLEGWYPPGYELPGETSRRKR